MHAYICCKANKNNYGLCSSFSDEDELNDNISNTTNPKWDFANLWVLIIKLLIYKSLLGLFVIYTGE